MEQWSKRAICIAFAFASIPVIGNVGANAKEVESQGKLNWQLAPTDKVGSQKSGAACFPNRTLFWRELARPDAQILDLRLKALLEAHGVGDASASGEVTSLKAMVCLPWLGMGAQPKSEIKLSIRWTLLSKDLQTTVRITEATVARKKFDLRSDSNLLLDAIEASLLEALSPER